MKELLLLKWISSAGGQDGIYCCDNLRVFASTHPSNQSIHGSPTISTKGYTAHTPTLATKAFMADPILLCMPHSRDILVLTNE